MDVFVSTFNKADFGTDVREYAILGVFSSLALAVADIEKSEDDFSLRGDDLWILEGGEHEWYAIRKFEIDNAV